MRRRFPFHPAALCALVAFLSILILAVTPSEAVPRLAPGQVRVMAFDWNGDVLKSGRGQLCSSGGDVIVTAALVEGSAFIQVIYGGRAYPAPSVGGVDDTTGLLLLRVAGLPAAGHGSFLAPLGARQPDEGVREVWFSPDTGGEPRDLLLVQAVPLPLTPDVYYIRTHEALPPAGTALYARTGQLAGILVDVGTKTGNTAILAGGDRVLGLAETRCLLQDVTQWSAKRSAPWAESPQVAYLRAARALLSGQPGEAITLLRNVAGTNTPYESEVQFTLGECYLSEGFTYRAIKAFLAALGPAVEPCTVYKRLAWAYSEAGEFAQTEEVLRRMLTAEPDNPWAHMFLAHTLIRLGRPRDAEAAAARATVLNPASPCAHIELGFARAAQGRYEEALQAFKTATWLDDTDARGFSGLGQAYLRVSRPLHAIVVLRHAVKLDPSLAEEWCFLGQAYAEASLPDRALEAYNMAVCADSSYSTALCRLARQYMALGLCVEAVDVLVRALKASPENPWLHFYLGQIYAAGGDTDRAMDTYKALREIHALLARQLMLRIGSDARKNSGPPVL